MKSIEVNKTYTGKSLSTLSLILSKNEYFTTSGDIPIDTELFSIFCRIGSRLFHIREKSKETYLISLFINVKPLTVEIDNKELLKKIIDLKCIIKNTLDMNNNIVSYEMFDKCFDIILPMEI